MFIRPSVCSQVSVIIASLVKYPVQKNFGNKGNKLTQNIIFKL